MGVIVWPASCDFAPEPETYRVFSHEDHESRQFVSASLLLSRHVVPRVWTLSTDTFTPPSQAVPHSHHITKKKKTASVDNGPDADGGTARPHQAVPCGHAKNLGHEAAALRHLDFPRRARPDVRREYRRRRRQGGWVSPPEEAILVFSKLADRSAHRTRFMPQAAGKLAPEPQEGGFEATRRPSVTCCALEHHDRDPGYPGITG